MEEYMDQPKTISYWHSEGANHLYMDTKGYVYRVTKNNYNKPIKKVRVTMKYFKTKMIVMSIIIFALWVGIATANESNKRYTATAIDGNYNPNMVIALDMEQKWVNFKSLKNIIITTNYVSMIRAREDYIYYKSVGDVIDVTPGRYKVTFIEEFQGFWLFEVLEIYEDTNNQQDML